MTQIYLGNEYTLSEKPAIDYLVDKLDYSYIQGDKLTPETGERDSYSDAILIKRFSNSLLRLNPWMNEQQIQKTIKDFIRADSLGSNLLEINEKFYDYIVNLKYTVEETDSNGNRKSVTVQFIDFENIENNDFLAVNQFKIQILGGTKHIIPDIVIFVNGLPLVVIECKSPFIEDSKVENKGKSEAVTQLRRYMDIRESTEPEGNPRLFYTNALCCAINKYNGYLGTISSEYSHFLEWKDSYPVKKSDIVNVENDGQNILLQGVLEKHNLLDILQNFVVFEGDSKTGKKIKKNCRYQQFRAVCKAIEKIKSGNDNINRGGVIWHTQGSGKSLSMVFLAKKIKRDKNLKNSTIVIVTDRIDLDKQIYNVFSNSLNQYAEIVRADSISEMKTLLSQAQPKIITTTIQKFQSETEESGLKDKNLVVALYKDKDYEILTEKENVIVLTDEAHRSQYKGTAKNLRQALPNAIFIGFTGTPIDKKDKSTERTFGSYIDKYGLKQSVEDGATIPIVYEGRKPELHVIGKDSIEDIFKNEFQEKSEEEKNEIIKRYVNKRAISENESRIEEISKDILSHYKEQIFPNGFKAQIVCMSRRACVTYYNMLKKHMKTIMGEDLEIRVIFSCDNNDLPELKQHRTAKSEQDMIIKDFLKPIEILESNPEKKKDCSNLCFIIVKDMLLTGFDAPIEQVMYLDRSLIEHNLLQAIARVNRTYNSAKTCGFIVDYFGVSNYLEDALKIFDKADIGEPMISIQDLVNKMENYRESVMSIFSGVDKNNIDELVEVLKPEDKRTVFEVAYKRFASLVESLLPLHVSTQFVNDLRWLSYIRASVKLRYEPQNKIDVTDCGEKVRKIIQEHLVTEGIEQFIKPIELFKDDFLNSLNSLSDKAKALRMEHLIRHTIGIKLEENPEFYEGIGDKLKKILEETEDNWAERKRRLETLINEDIKTGIQSESEKLGLDEKEYSIFCAIKKYFIEDNSEYKEIEFQNIDKDDLINIVKGLKEVIENNIVVDWTINSTKTDNMQRAVKKCLISKFIEQIGYNNVASLSDEILALVKIHYKE